MPRMSEVSRAKDKHRGLILAKPNVVGVGIGYRERKGSPTEELVVIALVERKLPKAGLEPEEMVPIELDGVFTDVIEVGILRAHQARTNRWRPAPGGVSIGHYQITAGTLGCVVRDVETGDRLILSNNHVLANINRASLGDPILQPGAFDGGQESTDTFAVLERFLGIRFKVEPPTCSIAKSVAWLANSVAQVAGSKHRLMAYRSEAEAVNRVDAALARPLEGGMVLDEILEIGVVGGVRPATLGMIVRKSGRTSGLTTGQIRVLEATIDVDYSGRTARFDDQIITTPMSEPGDSGSLLVAADALQAVGLLFAGSQQATVYNPIEVVLERLNVTL
jgi:hypothetical protein